MPLSPVELLFRLLIGPQTSFGASNQARRDSWVQKAVQQIPPASRILDAGAGELRYKAFCGHLNYVSQDSTKYDGIGDGKGIQMRTWNTSQIDIVCDITNIPEEEESFDAILCTEVLEHLPSSLAALREFARLLKVGGLLIMTAPFCSLTHFSPHHYTTGFNRYYYEKWLPELGFEIIEICFNGNYFEYLAQEIRRVPSVSDQYTTSNLETRLQRYLRMFAQNVILRWLEKLSTQDNGSFELLSFGLHLRAIRRRNDLNRQ